MFENNYPYGMPTYQNQPQPGYYPPQPRPIFPAQQPQSPTNKLYANGIEDVKNRPLPVNSDYLFLDNDKPLIYRKMVDSTGKMSVETFKIVPYEDDTPAQTLGDNYVLKSDFEALKKDVEALRSKKTGGNN